jgi:hypothetical protein
MVAAQKRDLGRRLSTKVSDQSLIVRREKISLNSCDWARSQL